MSIKPRGHLQARPSKDRVLFDLEQCIQATTREIAERVKLSPRCTRQHLYGLESSGEVKRIEIEARKTAWCLSENVDQARAAVMAQASQPMVPRASISNTALARIEARTVSIQIHRPAGQWRIDHATRPRSVFDLCAEAA